MQVGDLVCLSSAGNKVQSNIACPFSYGLVVQIYADIPCKRLYRVILFNNDGYRQNVRNYYRYELKKFK